MYYLHIQSLSFVELPRKLVAKIPNKFGGEFNGVHVPMYPRAGAHAILQKPAVMSARRVDDDSRQDQNSQSALLGPLPDPQIIFTNITKPQLAYGRFVLNTDHN